MFDEVIMPKHFLFKTALLIFLLLTEGAVFYHTRDYI
jgi:hypothetical protein